MNLLKTICSASPEILLIKNTEPEHTQRPFFRFHTSCLIPLFFIGVFVHLSVLTFAQYSGGSSDGYTMIANESYVTTCSLPAYENVSKGGSADGYVMVANESFVAPCVLPAYENISKGGSSDGYALLVQLNKAGKDSCFNYIGCNITGTITKDTSLCKGNSITLTAGGGMNYNWTKGSDTISIGTMANITVTPDSTISYIVAISDTSCTIIKTVKVTVKDISRASVSGKTVVCSGDSTSLTASGGTSYNWSSGDTTPSIKLKPVQDNNYTVKINNGCGDTTIAVSVSIFNTSSVKISGDTLVCTGTSTKLTASGGPNYKWNTGATTESILVIPVQDTSYKVVVTNGNCKDSAVLAIKTTAPPTADAGKDTTVCKGNKIQLNGTVGTINYLSLLQWTPATGLDNDTIAQPVFSDSVSRAYIFSVSNGVCTKTDTVNISVSSSSATISGNTSMCAGDSTVLTVGTQNFVSLLWNTGDTTASIVFKPVKNSVVSVIINNGGNCTATATVKVGNYPVGVSAGVDKVICKGNSIKLDGIVGTQNFVSSIQWAPTTGLDKDTLLQPTASPSITTTYILKAASGICAKTDTVTVTVHPLPNVTATAANSTLFKGDSTKLSVTDTQNISTWLWTPSAGLNDTAIANPVAAPQVTTIYTVLVTDKNGCTGSDTIIIKITEPDTCGKIFVPSAFSPNSDANKMNEVFRVKIPSNCVKELLFAIYDRWGVEMYKTSDIKEATEKGWDGTYKGNVLNTGVYVYFLKIMLMGENEAQTVSGNISLLK